ncbi:MAG: transporter [Rhizomicrobium sp.]
MHHGGKAGGMLLAIMLLGTAAARAADSGAARQPMADAWWTGPLLAASAGTLPPGHFLFEPYFFDMVPFASYDSRGVAHDVPSENDFGSFSYVLYGVADRFSLGFIPRFGFEEIAGGKSSSTLQLGDWSLQGQYQLTEFEEGHLLPTISLNVGETFPTGKFDQLDRSSDGFGSGAYTTALSLYSQDYFWMPTGRILRTRLNLTYATSSHVALQNVSVYGTIAGFLGDADPGVSSYGDLAFEYSLTRNWVAAIDFWAEQDNPTRLSGVNEGNGPATPFVSRSGTGREMILAPAIEYNFSLNLGVIAGARIFVWGRNETATAAPVLAIDYVH